MPSIVILFADDTGIGELGTRGHRELATPHIDRLASEGQRACAGSMMPWRWKAISLWCGQWYGVAWYYGSVSRPEPWR